MTEEEVSHYTNEYGSDKENIIRLSLEHLDSRGIVGYRRERCIRVIINKTKHRVGFIDPITLFAIIDFILSFFKGDEMVIQLVTPTDGQKIKGGTNGNIVVSITDQGFTDFVKSGEVIIRDANGATVFQGGGNFVDATSSVPYTYPLTVGVYSIEARALGIWRYVNAACKGSFEII